MNKLIVKDLRITIPKAIWLYCLLSALIVIPSYPMIVGVGYCILGVFIVFSSYRTNQDMQFSATLPVSRANIVASKCVVVGVFEALQILAAVPFALIANLVVSPNGNSVGMDPNFAFFGMVFACYGLFNLIFLPLFFRTGDKPGFPVTLGLVGFCVLYVCFELFVNLVPGVRAVLDSLEPSTFGWQAIVLAAGVLLFAGLSWAAYRISVKKFEKVSL